MTYTIVDGCHTNIIIVHTRAAMPTGDDHRFLFHFSSPPHVHRMTPEQRAVWMCSWPSSACLRQLINICSTYTATIMLCLSICLSVIGRGGFPPVASTTWWTQVNCTNIKRMMAFVTSNHVIIFVSLSMNWPKTSFAVGRMAPAKVTHTDEFLIFIYCGIVGSEMKLMQRLCHYN